MNARRTADRSKTGVIQRSLPKSTRAVLATAAPACLMLIAAGCATTPEEPRLTDQQRQLNVESFDYVWTTIRDKHFDPELGGLDWQAVRDELRPKVEQATVMSEAREAMRDMLARLEQSHFGIIPADAYDDLEQPAGEGSRDGGTGIDLRVIDGQALVTAVADGSPADDAGVRSGWEIVRIGSEDIPRRLETLTDELEDDRTRPLLLTRTVQARLTGPVGDAVTTIFEDGHGDQVKLDFELVERRGRKAKLGHLPALYVWHDVRFVDDSIGYIAFNYFLDPGNVMGAVARGMESFMDADGVIIDLRGNEGGIGAMAMGMAGWFIAERNRRLGVMHTRTGELKFVVSPRARTYEGPLAVLVDGLSASTSEILAGGLQGLDRARVFGSPTAGAALPSRIEKLPNGDGFQYAVASYVSEGGDVLEDTGVIPDTEVHLNREALLRGEDPVLDAAVNWIRIQQ